MAKLWKLTLYTIIVTLQLNVTKQVPKLHPWLTFQRSYLHRPGRDSGTKRPKQENNIGVITKTTLKVNIISKEQCKLYPCMFQRPLPPALPCAGTLCPSTSSTRNFHPFTKLWFITHQPFSLYLGHYVNYSSVEPARFLKTFPHRQNESYIVASTMAYNDVLRYHSLGNTFKPIHHLNSLRPNLQNSTRALNQNFSSKPRIAYSQFYGQSSLASNPPKCIYVFQTAPPKLLPSSVKSPFRNLTYAPTPSSPHLVNQPVGQQRLISAQPVNLYPHRITTTLTPASKPSLTYESAVGVLEPSKYSEPSGFNKPLNLTENRNLTESETEKSENTNTDGSAATLAKKQNS